jgi:hypothetical protein
LRHCEASRERKLLDRARRGSHATSGRSVGLRNDKRNVVAGFEQALERLCGECWRAGED